MSTGAGLVAVSGCNTLGNRWPSGGHERERRTPTSTAPSGTETIRLSGITGAARISPAGLYVEPGETVVFAVESGPHSSRAYHPENGTELRIPEAADPWRSPVMSTGQSFSIALTVEGTYDYYCATHANHGRVGRIVVGAPGGPAEGTMPPDGRVPDSQAIVKNGWVSSTG